MAILHKTQSRAARAKPIKKNVFSKRTFSAIKPRDIGKASKGFKNKKANPLKMMPFIPALADSVVQGITTGSFRYIIHPFYPSPGEVFTARCNSAELPGRYLCISRIKSSIRKVRLFHWSEIGVPSPQDYEDIMLQVLGTETLDYDRSGYYYSFRRCG